MVFQGAIRTRGAGESEYGFVRHPLLSAFWLVVFIAMIVLGYWVAAYVCLIIGFTLGVASLLTNDFPRQMPDARQ